MTQPAPSNASVPPPAPRPSLRPSPPAPPRPRWPRALAALATLAALALAALLVSHHRAPRAIRIATGQRGGVFLPIGQVLAATFDREIRGVDARAIESPGGEATVRMLEHHEAELGLVSNNVEGGRALRLIAPLYEETLQVVVRADAQIHGPLDLRHKRVNVGLPGSGTEAIAWQILHHFGIADGDITRSNLGPLDSADALRGGRVDAAFIVAGMRTPVVDELLHREDMRLLSLGDTSRSGSALEGIRIDAPYLLVTDIPERTYGEQPAEPVGTVKVKALLVARADLDDDLVADLTGALFAAKVQLAEREKLLARLTERFDPADSPFPVHPGADRYYRRDDPSFVSQYSDQISLSFTVGALLWSAFSALSAARRRARRGRIETHMQEAQALAADVRAAETPLALQTAREALEALRFRLFAELAAERLEANDAFAILQRYLDAQLAEADRRTLAHAA